MGSTPPGGTARTGELKEVEIESAEIKSAELDPAEVKVADLESAELEAAEAAQMIWRKTTAKERAAILRRWFNLMMDNKPAPNLIIYLESDVEALKSRIVERSRGEESELASPENNYLSNLNDLYRPWIMKCGHPFLIIDTEIIDFRTEEGLEQVVEGIIDAVPGTRSLFA